MTRRVLMLAQSPIDGDARVLREAASLGASGYPVHIVGRGVPDGFIPPAGVTVADSGRSRGLSPRRSGATERRLHLAGRASRWLLLPEHRATVEREWSKRAAADLARCAPYDVVHAHDFNTLEVAARLADGWAAALVYDAHEHWFGRALPGRRDPVRRLRGRARERRLARRADAVITVSDALAERFVLSGVDKVAVVRNTFPPPTNVPPITLRPLGVVYAGRVGLGRDLETVFRAAPLLHPLRILVVGPSDEAFVASLTVPASAAIHPSRTHDQIDELYAEQGIALVPLADSCENHRVALPNKLFHAVRAGVPVVAADLPAIRHLVQRYKLGTLYRPGDATSLAAAVAQLTSAYPKYCRTVSIARGELSWDMDEQRLLKIYNDLPTRQC